MILQYGVNYDFNLILIINFKKNIQYYDKVFSNGSVFGLFFILYIDPVVLLLSV